MVWAVSRRMSSVCTRSADVCTWPGLSSANLSPARRRPSPLARTTNCATRVSVHHPSLPGSRRRDGRLSVSRRESHSSGAALDSSARRWLELTCLCALVRSDSRLMKEYKEILKNRSAAASSASSEKAEITIFPPDESNLYLWHAYSQSPARRGTAARGRACSACLCLTSLLLFSSLLVESWVRPTRRTRVASSV